MRKSLAVLVVVLTASLTLFAQQPNGPRGRGPGGPGPGGRGPGMPRENNPVAGAPYSGTRVSVQQQILADGTVITRQEQAQIYRDGQGRTRTEITPQGPNSQGSAPRVTISDPVAGVRRELDTQNRTSFETPMRRPNNAASANRTRRPNPPAAASRPADPNVKRETLGAQFMNGVSATGTRITRTIPAGTIGNSQAIQTVEERWISEELKVPVMVKITDPRTGTNVEMLNSITRAEPDPSLFQTPVGFTVKTRQPGPGGPGGGPGRRGPRTAGTPLP